jgi:hypothetical protein
VLFANIFGDKDEELSGLSEPNWRKEMSQSHQHPWAKRALILAYAALGSSAISLLIAAIPGNLLVGNRAHLLFVVVVGVVGILFGIGGAGLQHLDAGFVFFFFLFEPLGRLLLYREAVPNHYFLILSIGFVVAYFFGAEEPTFDQAQKVVLRPGLLARKGRDRLWRSGH